MRRKRAPPGGRYGTLEGTIAWASDSTNLSRPAKDATGKATLLKPNVRSPACRARPTYVSNVKWDSTGTFPVSHRNFKMTGTLAYAGHFQVLCRSFSSKPPELENDRHS